MCGPAGNTQVTLITAITGKPQTQTSTPINLQTGVSTLLGILARLPVVRASASQLCWSATGIFFVQSTEDGIQSTRCPPPPPLDRCFSLTRETCWTPLPVQSGAAYYGLDVWPDGSRFVIRTSANGRVNPVRRTRTPISLDAAA